MNTRGPHWWLINIGSGKGLMPSGNKPLSNQCWSIILTPHGVTKPQWTTEISRSKFYEKYRRLKCCNIIVTVMLKCMCITTLLCEKYIVLYEQVLTPSFHHFEHMFNICGIKMCGSAQICWHVCTIKSLFLKKIKYRIEIEITCFASCITSFTQTEALAVFQLSRFTGSGWLSWH